MKMKSSSPSVEMALSRRRFIATTGSALGVAVIVGALPRFARADNLPQLSADDPTAQALGYNPDSSRVDAAKFSTHQASMACANCNFFQGGSAASGPCQLFPGKAVDAKGWCSGYAKKA